jgi:hypothetical protein
MTDSPWKRKPDPDPREGVTWCHCPHCRHELNAATDTLREGDRPQPGDISVCVYCAGINQWSADMTLEAVTGDELVLVLADPMVKKAIAVVKSHHWNRPGD